MDVQLGSRPYQSSLITYQSSLIITIPIRVVSTETISLPTPGEFRSQLESEFFPDILAYFALAVASTVVVWLLLKSVG